MFIFLFSLDPSSPLVPYLIALHADALAAFPSLPPIAHNSRGDDWRGKRGGCTVAYGIGLIFLSCLLQLIRTTTYVRKDAKCSCAV